MSKKQEFIKYVEELMDCVKKMDIPRDMEIPPMNEEAQLYWEAFTSQKEVEKPMFTDNGKLILKFLQENETIPMWKARDIAEGLFISSRAVSGAMRKLVSDGFVEKVGQDPVIYALTEKGKNINIED